MAPSSLEKPKKKKSKDAVTSKAPEPASAPTPAEASKEESKKRKRKSQAGADIPNAPTSAQPAVETESSAKKAKTKTKPEAQTTEPPAVVETAPKKKSKSKQGKVADEKGLDVEAQEERMLLKGKGQSAESSEKTKGKKKGKTAGVDDKRQAEGQQAAEASAEMVESEKKTEKKTKGTKGAMVAVGEDGQPSDEANPTEVVATDKPRSSKKAPKAVTAPLIGISHPTLTPKPTEKKKKRKSLSPEPEPSASDDEAPVAETGVGDVEGDEHLYGFSTDDDDSSDEEMGEDWGGIDAGKLPTIAKDDAIVKKRLEKAKRHPTEDRGVICLGRIPHGFYEDQMRKYFSQFGTVTRLRLSRNKKTGRSKHYAFIEFDSSSVAQIVADTMDNYLLMGHILTCKVIPKDEVHPELWIGANRKWRVIPRDRIARVQHNKPRTEEEQERAEQRLLKRQEQRKRKLQEAGINYDFGAVAYKKSKPVEA